MAFMKISSPHAHSPGDTGTVMKRVMFACVPGLLVLTYFFGLGGFFNVVTASLTAMFCEAAILMLRRLPIGFYLRDYSAALTGVLLGLALPPYCPWWIVVIGSSSAIILAKHLYGGMGYNPFNPAMVAYVLLLISFPLEMTQWAIEQPLLAEGANQISPVSALQKIWFSVPLDGYSGATPLDLFKQSHSLPNTQPYTTATLLVGANWANAGWAWVNIAFLLGGSYLLFHKVFTWHTPVSMLTAIVVLSLIFSERGGSTFFHLLSGATMLGAFFIATDPVSSAVSNKGRLVYGAGIGVLVYVIRVWGNYPDAIAFAVLLMNFSAPFIDYYTLPRTYGYSSAGRATARTQ